MQTVHDSFRGLDERLPVSETNSSVVEFVAVSALSRRVNARQSNSDYRAIAPLSTARERDTRGNKE